MSRILIAEDDAFLVKMYKLELEEQKHEIETVANGEEAINSIEASQPDLLLLDLLMPKVDGFKVLEHIKEKGYVFPIVILSNLSQEIDKDKCKDLGASDYFVKSDMDMADIAKITEKHLNK